jgi:AbrB family looped-hinge helix DNA binding protein
MATVSRRGRVTGGGGGGLIEELNPPAHGVCALSADWDAIGNIIPMEAVIDSVGRIVVPKPLRDALGLAPGTVVDISQYGSGAQITPGGRTARLERDTTGRLVARSDTPVTDETMFALIDAGRR